MEHWLWIILAALFFGEIQTSTCFLCLNKCEQGDVIAAEGDTVTLGCRYETSDQYPYLFWYKQEINNFPKYVLLRGTSGTEDNDQEFPKDRFDAEAKKTENSVPLKIQKLQLSDSAVYYCALRPTVTGNSKTLYKNLWTSKKKNPRVLSLLIFLMYQSILNLTVMTF
uniref:Ig-like domain-containing protein n=1 Tax=Haplochromis burtoni TaxID=8153 RepID=A0A3Q2V2G2_HAPBU